MMEIKLLPGSEIEIVAEISAEIFESCAKEIIGEPVTLEKMAVLAVQKEYPKIIERHKIRPIGRPEVTITKMARNSSLGFKLKTAIMPEVKLPDYKGMKLEEIVKKTEVDVPKALTGTDEKGAEQAKIGLVLNEIAEREKIEVLEEELEREVEKIMAEHKELDRNKVRVYIYGILRNEKVFNFLEKHAGANGN